MTQTNSRPWTDIALAFAIAALVALGAWRVASQVPTAVLDPRNPDIYFSSDISRVQENMVARFGDHRRNSVHPLFSIQLYPLFHAVARITGNDLGSEDPLSPSAIKVGHLMSGLGGGLAAAAFFALLRLMRIKTLDAIVFVALASISAFSLFWFTIPETYPWGALTILLALILAALSAHRTLPATWFVLANILTLSITTTNWMIGLLVTWRRFPLGRAILWASVAFALTLALAMAQKAYFPTSRLFIHFGGEKNYVMQAQSGGPLRVWTSFFSHTIVAPEVTTAPHVRVEGQTVLRAQFSPLAGPTIAAKLGVGCWLLLLAAGVYALFALPDMTAVRITLGLGLLGQLGLHTVYGAETFLYAGHYGPMLVAMAALATRTRLRFAVLSLAAVLLVCLVANNFPQHRRTMDLLAHSQQRLDSLPPTTAP